MSGLNPPAAVRQAETEEACIVRAQAAVSESAWIVGECACTWTKQWARGRTDADFGSLLGLSGDEIYKRRRVWEVYGETASKRNLSFTHHYVAMNWNDAEEVLQWAEENEASVAEMKAWRRAVHGEDLTQPATDATEIVPPVGSELPEDKKPLAPSTTVPTPKPAREDYSPFRKTRLQAAPREKSKTEPSALEPAKDERSERDDKQAEVEGSGTQAAPSSGETHRSDAEIVSDANELARLFYGSQGYQVEEGYCFDNATHPHERGCWNLAVIAYEFIEGTPVQDALDSLEEA